MINGAKKMRAYYCLNKETHWLINFSIENSQEDLQSRTKIALMIELYIIIMSHLISVL